MTQHLKVLRLIVVAASRLICLLLTTQPALAQSLETGVAVPFDEQVSWRRLDCGVRVFVNAPPTQTARPRVLFVYATPNGNTIEQTLGTDVADKWGQFGGPRAYTELVQPQPFVDPAAVRATIPADAPDVRIAFPVRPADAPSGSKFQQQIAGLPRDQREAVVLQEIMNGNVPEFFRRLIPVRVEASDDAGIRHVAVYFVMPDYLAIGADDDCFRVPITPASATAIADKFDASLITAKISDDVFAAAQVKLDPKPLTKDRDTVATFWQHHQIIEEQLLGKPRGLLVAGIKKDVVLTNRLKEKPHKVAIYGWHESNSQPIQSLYVGHVDWYVDYSHGVRLMSQQIIVDNQPLKVSDVLKDSRLCPLLSTEGPIDVSEVRNAAGWGR